MQLLDFIECEKDLLLEVLKIRNSKEVRENSFNSSIISEEAHFKFIDELKKSESKKYFALIEAGELIGVLSFTDINNNEAVCGCYKNIYLKRNGIGKILLGEVLDEEAKKLNLKKVFLNIFKKNIASIRSAEKVGFSLYEDYGNYIKYIKNF